MGDQRRRNRIHLPSAEGCPVRFRQAGHRRRCGILAAPRGDAEQDARLHHHPVRLHPGQCAEADPRHRSADAGHAASGAAGTKLRAVLPIGQRRLRGGKGGRRRQRPEQRHGQRLPQDPYRRRRQLQADLLAGVRPCHRRCQPARDGEARGEAHRAATCEGPGASNYCCCRKAASISLATCRPISSR